MLINLFEDRAEEILSPKYVSLLTALAFPGNAGYVVDVAKAQANTLANDAIAVAFLLHVRAYHLAQCRHFPNVDYWKDPLPEYAVQILGPNLKYWTRLSRVVSMDDMTTAYSLSLNVVYGNLIHFKGSKDGLTPPIQIPEILNHRIRPTDNLVEVIRHYLAIEERYRAASMDGVTNESELTYNTHRDVPNRFIRIDPDTKARLVKSYVIEGINYGWYDLGQGSSNPEEAKAMGHCGTNGAATNMVSFRSIRDIYIKNDDIIYQYFEPHLTAAIKDNTLLELRGKGNSKPKEMYHPYIIDLFETYPLADFTKNSSYRNDDQFLLPDLSEELRERLVAINPLMGGASVIFFNKDEYPDDIWQIAKDRIMERLERHFDASVLEFNDKHYLVYMESNGSDIEDKFKEGIDLVFRSKSDQVSWVLNTNEAEDFVFSSWKAVPDVVHQAMPHVLRMIRDSDLATGVTPSISRILRRHPRVRKSSKIYKGVLTALRHYYNDTRTATYANLFSKLEEIIPHADCSYYIEPGSTINDKIRLQVSLRETYNNIYDDDDGNDYKWIEYMSTEAYDAPDNAKALRTEILAIVEKIENENITSLEDSDNRFLEQFATSQIDMFGDSLSRGFYQYLDKEFQNHYKEPYISKVEKRSNRLFGQRG